MREPPTASQVRPRCHTRFATIVLKGDCHLLWQTQFAFGSTREALGSIVYQGFKANLTFAHSRLSIGGPPCLLEAKPSPGRQVRIYVYVTRCVIGIPGGCSATKRSKFGQIILNIRSTSSMHQTSVSVRQSCLIKILTTNLIPNLMGFEPFQSLPRPPPPNAMLRLICFHRVAVVARHMTC